MFPIPKRPLLPRSLPVLWFLSLAIALGSLRFLIADIALVMPAMLHHALERPLLLYAHIFFAPIALAIMPFQFGKKLRVRRPGLHRWLGRAYGVAVLISGTAGVFLGLQTIQGPVAASGLVTLAVAWLSTTAFAVYFAITRDIPAHRHWMIRSGALTVSAVTLRLYMIAGALTVGEESSYPLICWLCWVPNLMFAEWLIRRDTRRAAASIA